MKKELNPVLMWCIFGAIGLVIIVIGLNVAEVPLGPEPEVEVPEFQPPAGYQTPGQGGGQGAPMGAPAQPPSGETE